MAQVVFIFRVMVKMALIAVLRVVNFLLTIAVNVSQS